MFIIVFTYTFSILEVLLYWTVASLINPTTINNTDLQVPNMTSKPTVAIILLIISLALLITYAADVAVASSLSSPDDQAQAKGAEGFLPFNDAVRGGAFGGGAVILSVVGFVVGREDKSNAVVTLLFVNGGLIIAGMIGLIIQGALAPSNMTTIASTLAMGVLLIGLGFWKMLHDTRVTLKKH